MSALSKQYHSLIIAEPLSLTIKNTWDDWHLVPTSRPVVNPPTVNENYVQIPGRDGFVDFSELLGGKPIYGSRTGSWEFIAHPDYALSEPWHYKYTTIMEYLHGKFVTIYLEDDLNFFYEGRLKVSSWRSDPDWSVVTIDYVLQPYKHAGQEDGLGDWLWNPFNFLTGRIVDLYEVPVQGTKTITIFGDSEPIVPTINVKSKTGSLTVTFGGVTHSLELNDNVFQDLILRQGQNNLVFSGNGVVSVQFRRGML